MDNQSRIQRIEALKSALLHAQAEYNETIDNLIEALDSDTDKDLQPEFPLYKLYPGNRLLSEDVKGEAKDDLGPPWYSVKRGKRPTLSRAKDCREIVDLRDQLENPDLWSIGDQLLTESCVGFAIAGGLLDYYINRWSQAGKAKFNLNYRVNPRLTWMAAKFSETRMPHYSFEDSSGVKNSLEEGLIAMLESFFFPPDTFAGIPFSQPFWNPSWGRLHPDYLREDFPAMKSNIGIWVETRETTSQELTEQLTGLKHWVCHQGPILMEFVCGNEFRNYSGDVLNATTLISPTTMHAVAIIGYTSDGFIVRNSWGDHWGEAGHATLGWDYIKKFSNRFMSIYKTEPNQ